jgi:hypothetical protein
MKSANETAPQKMISAPTIVVLCVGVALIAYMLVQPLFAPKAELPAASGGTAKVDSPAAKTLPETAPAQPATVQPAAPAAVPVDKGVAAAPVQPAQNNGVELSSDRDPFVPSTAIARAAAAAQTKTETAAVVPVAPPKIEPPLVKAKPNRRPEVKPEIKPVATPPPAVFAWKGVVGGFGPQQVVLIQHNARTYILHQGDPVPGTKYVVAEITSEMVVLASPGEQLRLSKKKEAKING